MWICSWRDGNVQSDGQFPLDLFTSCLQQALSCGFTEPYVDCAGQDSPCKHPSSACKRAEEEEEEQERDLVPVSDSVRVAETSTWTSLCINWVQFAFRAQVTQTYIQTFPLASNDFYVYLWFIRILHSFTEWEFLCVVWPSLIVLFTGLSFVV